jgi:diketogulonate reductase-like aldo/keto reductase
VKLPLLGLGTYELTGAEGSKIVETAIDIGYRHIDTAHVYGNHKAIKKGIKGTDRSELFITSKFTLDQIDPSKIVSSVEESCDLALKELGTDYLDLYLIHWPDRSAPMAKIFKAMEKLVKKKKILKAGVSNFTVHHLEDFAEEGCHPAANQVEFHPYLYQKKLLDFCRENKIELIAYRPLGKKKLVKEPLFKKIGLPYEKTPAQVILRWFIQKKIPVIPKASSKKHLIENFDIFDFSLTAAEMKQIDALNQNKRFCSPDDPELQY